MVLLQSILGIGLLAAAHLPAATQVQEDFYLIATHVSVDGKILELDMPAEMDGERFLLGLGREQGEGGVHVMVAQRGTHRYEVRRYPEWHGTLAYVAVNVEAAHGVVKEPSLAENIGIFLDSQSITPSLINALPEHTIFAVTWTKVLSITFAFAALAFALVMKRPKAVSVFLAFLAAWGLTDLVMMFDHVSIATHHERFNPGMPPLTAAGEFADKADVIIGKETWGYDQVDVGANFLAYRFAEKPIGVPSSRSPKFWISQHAPDGGILLQHRGYYLVRKDTP